jgi:UDP-galactose transporter B1
MSPPQLCSDSTLTTSRHTNSFHGQHPPPKHQQRRVSFLLDLESDQQQEQQLLLLDTTTATLSSRKQSLAAGVDTNNTNNNNHAEETACLIQPSSSSRPTTIHTANNTANNNTNNTKDAYKLLFGAAGVYACYLLYGHIQEDLYSYRTYDNNKFQNVWCLQALECAANVLVGMIGRYICGGTSVRFRPFVLSGAAQVLAKVLTSLSLAAGLSFPVCVLAKSAKLVPVMMGQLILGGSSYGAQEYAVAASVVVGTFLLSMGKHERADGTTHSTPAGLCIIVLSLVMDGLTGGLQKKLKRETQGKPPTTYDFLLYTNMAMGAIALSIAIAIGDLQQGFVFMSQNPVVLQMVLLVCILSAMGQSFVFYLVATFDPMVCATVTTTRKILSVLWSITYKGHYISPQGYVGLVLAIGGLLTGMQSKHHSHTSHGKKHPTSPSSSLKRDDRDMSLC